MINKTTRVRESVRMFIGLEVPEDVRTRIREHLKDYTRHTKKLVPEENWHITILFVGEVLEYKRYLEPLEEAMPQAFLPTLSLTHIGKGLQPHQLWAFAKNTTLLGELQKQLIDRLGSLPIDRESNVNSNFTPHIKLGDLRTGPTNDLLADLPMLAAWRVEKLNIYHSDLSHRGANYSVMGHINLS